MKKTIIALVATAACAMGATEKKFDEATKTATITLTFNVNQLKNISDVNFAGADEAYNFFLFDGGTWTGGDDAALGLGNNGYANDDETGFWGYYVKGSSSGKAVDTGLGRVFTSSTDWDTIKNISLVYSYSTPESGATTTNVAFTIAYLDGTISTQGATKNNIVFNGVSGFTSTGVTVNDTYVVSFDANTNYTTLDEAKALSAAMASASIPEPTTATLSLLALAGLAARRRRR